MYNLYLRFYQHLEAIFDHLGFGTTKTWALPNPHLLSCFSPNTLKIMLSLLIPRLHFHLYHQNIHFKHITSNQRNCQLSLRALNRLDLGCFPNHCAGPFVTFTSTQSVPASKSLYWASSIKCFLKESIFCLNICSLDYIREVKINIDQSKGNITTHR